MMNTTVSDQAMRLKKIRLYLGMTREQLGHAIDISQFTLRSWENGSKSFTADGVQRVVAALNEKIRFICPFDWLMHGAGPSPIAMFEENTALSVNNIQIDSAQEKLHKEVVTFKQLNRSANVIMVLDDKFKPIADIGDYVGLIPEEISNIKCCLGKIIFLTTNNELSSFGILGKKQGKYQITELTGNNLFKIALSEVDKLYQFIWLRKIY